MSRYIDFYLIGELVDSHGNVHYEDLKNMPTVDTVDVVPMEYHERCVTEEIRKRANMVEVVRCKDCRYWQDYQEGHYPNELCPWDKNETPDEDDYCSFGERRI